MLYNCHSKSQSAILGGFLSKKKEAIFMESIQNKEILDERC